MVKVGVAYGMLERKHTEDTGEKGKVVNCGGSKTEYIALERVVT